MRVLLIDDDLLVRKAVRVMLESAGVEVAEASNGAEGIRAYRSDGADVVLTDMFMPDRDGLDVIRELRREFPEVKIIIMSGGGFGGSMDLLPVARLLGASAVLYKPFRKADILATIERVAQVGALV